MTAHREFLLNYGYAVEVVRRREAARSKRRVLRIDRRLHRDVALPLAWSKAEAKRLFYALLSVGDRQYLRIQDVAMLYDKSLSEVCHIDLICSDSVVIVID
jgi:hypothetical protein